MKAENFSPSPDFSWLCEELFQKIYETSSQKDVIGKPLAVRYLEIISNFIRLWRSTVGNYIYPALRLIIPFRDRRVYNVKENTLIKALCRFLTLPKNSETENRLLHWKQRAARGVKLSDFCVEEIRKRRKEYNGTVKITIDQLNEILNDISHEGNGKRMGYLALVESHGFNYCLEHMSFVELKFFFDIILKTRVIFGLENKFLSCWHPDAQDYLSVVSDLEVLSNRLFDPSERLRQTDLSIKLSHAFEPQLAKRTHASYEHVASKLSNNFLIEEKMDGERVQIHYINYGEEIKYLSRRGIDFSYLYGKSSLHGPISSFLKLHANVKDCILDGEMITYDTQKNIVLPFGLVKTSAMNHIRSEIVGIAPTESYRPLLIVFDLVYLNGKSLTSVDLERRKEYLNKILNPVEHIVETLQNVNAYDGESIRNSLEQAISIGSEGIVLKNLRSKYSVGSRNTDWIKIKPEYLEQFGENMDLLIIGRDQGKKDSFICGLAVKTSNNPLDSLKFISFCTIANGFSTEEFKEIERKTRGKWHKYSDNVPDPNILEFGTKVPYEWINPPDSVVLEIKARAVDNKDSDKKKYRSGCTLHFGYCKQVRYDKDWKNAASLLEFEEMKEARNYYNNKRPDAVLSNKKRPTKRAKLGIINSLLPLTITSPDSTIFRNHKFRVISDYFDFSNKKRVTQDELSELILNNGGNLIYSSLDKEIIDNNVLIIGSKLTKECKRLVEQNLVVIKPSWIISSVQAGYILPLKKSDIFQGKFNDAITKSSNTLFSEFTTKNFDEIIDANHSEQKELNSELILNHIPLFLFYGLKIAILSDNNNNTFTKFKRELEFNIECYGGEIVGLKDASVIIAFSGYTSRNTIVSFRLAMAKKSTRETHDSTPRIPSITNEKWICDSIASNSLMEMDAYRVR